MNKTKIIQKSRLLLCWSCLMFPTQALAGWEVKFIDKFDGDSVNWNNWTAQTDANFNNEVQCYTNDDSSVNKNFDVSGGTLKIIARKQRVSCAGLAGQSRNWTSGRINGKDKREFLYGRIESRIRFHDLNGGTWPAFWMLENRIAESPRSYDNDFSHWPNPGAGEIDIWEWFSNNSSTYITNFFNAGIACGSEHRPAYTSASDVQNWHDYAIDWNENNISFYMDDTLVAYHDISGCAQYKEPMFVLLNVAMGGNLGGAIDPNLRQATMEVDYLAHCTATNKNESSRCNESTPVAQVDADNDGVVDGIDQCPDTLQGTTVDTIGCLLAEEINVAPTVSLTIKQANVGVSILEMNDGLVQVSAEVFDENVKDTLKFTWSMNVGIPSPTFNNQTVTFDPASMVAGRSYNIKVTVTDSGEPALSSSATIQFSVAGQGGGNDDAVDSKTSAGSLNYLLLLTLLMFIMFRNKNI